MSLEINRAALCDCWFHLWFRLNVTGRSYGLRSPRGRSFCPLVIDSTAHRSASVFQVGYLPEARIGGQIGKPCFQSVLIRRNEILHIYNSSTLSWCSGKGP